MNYLEKLSDVASRAERLSETANHDAESSNSNEERENQSQSRTNSIGDSDRCSIKEKLKSALRKRSNESFEDLLELCTCVVEQSVYSSAPSRLDYFKNGIQEVKKIYEKAEAMKLMNGKKAELVEDGQKGLKRVKTQH